MHYSSMAAKRIQRPQGKRESQGPLEVKGAENLQVLEMNFGKLLLVYFEAPNIEALGVEAP